MRGYLPSIVSPIFSFNNAVIQNRIFGTININIKTIFFMLLKECSLLLPVVTRNFVFKMTTHFSKVNYLVINEWLIFF